MYVYIKEKPADPPASPYVSVTAASHHTTIFSKKNKISVLANTV
jgi:hypothetical protein